MALMHLGLKEKEEEMEIIRGKRGRNKPTLGIEVK